MTLDDLAKLKKTRNNKRVLEVLEERASEPIVQAQFRLTQTNAITSNSMTTVGTNIGNSFTIWTA